MKITDVRVEHYRWPKAKPIANGKHTYTHNDLNLLVIDTDEGITGYGCSWAIEFAESMGKAIIGMDPLCNEQIFARTYVPKFIGRRGTSAKTVSAIQQIHVHLDCAVPNVNFAEFYPPQYDAKVYEAFQNPVIFNADGTVSPSEAPGAGLDINRDALADFRVK